MGFNEARRFVREHWWGLVVAYAILLVLSFGALWTFAESMEIPSQIDYQPLRQRWVLHLGAAIMVGAHLTLCVDILERYLASKSSVGSGKSNAFDLDYSVSNAAAFYEAVADEYDRRNSPALLKTHEEVIGSIKPALSGRASPTVLDLGGGTGKLIAHHFYDRDDISWTYIDPSPAMAAQFNANLSGTRLNRSVDVRDVASFLANTHTAKYDVILLSLVLTSMARSPDWRKLAAILKTDGVLVIADIDAAYTSIHPFYVVEVKGKRHGLRPRPVALTQLISEIEGAGLKIESSRPVMEGLANYSFVAQFKRR